MTRVFILSERKYGELGARRHLACWHTLRPGVNPHDPDYDFDPCEDTKCHRQLCPTIERAIEVATSKLGEDFFGAPFACTEELEWFVKEDRVAEWEQVGDSIECSEQPENSK